MLKWKRDLVMTCLGCFMGCALALMAFTQMSSSERHLLFHAYRLGCKDSSDKRLIECNDAATRYQLSIEMLQAQLDLH